MSKSIQEIAELAAEWWADKVINPKFDNGAADFESFFASELASRLVKPVNVEQRKVFIDCLSGYIVEELKKDQKPIIDVDYNPCVVLREAAEKAGISNNNFPWKTTMWIDKNHVSVSYGYRADRQYLYANKTYWAERIKSCKEAIARYEDGEYCSYIKDEKERREHISEMLLNLNNDIKVYKIALEKAEI